MRTRFQKTSAGVPAAIRVSSFSISVSAVDQVEGVARVLALVDLFEGLVELRRGLVAV